MSSFTLDRQPEPCLTQGAEFGCATEQGRTPLEETRLKVSTHTFQGFRWLQDVYSRLFAMRGRRRMSVVETVSVGDKRFVSIIQVDGAEYLIGGGATVTLLTQLSTVSKQPQFRDALEAAQAGTGAI